MNTTFVICRDLHLPLEKRRCYGPNYSWVIPAEVGWQPVYFYARRDTAMTTCNKHQGFWPLEDIEVVEVAVEVTEVRRSKCEACGGAVVEVVDDP